MLKIFRKILEQGKYLKELVKLSLPVSMGFLGNTLINIGDVIVAGRHSTLALGAISVASAISMTFIIFGIGLISGVSALTANLRGAKKSSRSLIKPTLKYSFFVSIFIFTLIWLTIYFVPYIELKDNLTPLVVEYLKITSFATFPICGFVALKDFLQAYENVKFPNMVGAIGVVLNLILNIILVFGFWIIPSLGASGLAWSTLFTRSLMFLILFIYCIPYYKLKIKKNENFIKNLLKIGWPIAIAHFFEFLGFNIIAVLVGKFSALYAAAHNIIITISGATFAIPLAISAMISVKVGYALGEKNKSEIKKYYLSGLFLVILWESILAILFLICPDILIKIFTSDKEIITVSIPIMLCVACFLIFDGAQVATLGALRGLKKTKPIMWTMILSYFLIGTPIGCILAFKYGIILKGFWIGLALALFSASVISSSFLVYYYRKLTKNF